MRYFFKCVFCKARWTQEVPEDQAINGCVDYYGVVEHSCERYDLIVKKMSAFAPDSYKKFIAKGITASAIQWRKRPDGSTSKCGGKCRGAKGASCDCVCHGKNHGAG